MAKPVSSFTFSPTGLAVTFTDTSSNTPTAWFWDFGFKVSGVQVISSLQNPDPVIFPTVGVYNVSLVASNVDGTGNAFTLPLVLSENPNLNFTIRQMVQVDLPGGIAMDSMVFEQTIRKWQLYLQPLVVPNGIPDEDVFNEAKYPPLANVLIAKLIVWELIIKAASSAMVSFASASQLYNANIANQSNNTVLVADYSVNFDNTVIFGENPTVIINMIMVDGIDFGPSTSLDEAGVLAYLNGLNKGVFSYLNGQLVSLANSHILTTFNFTSDTISANSAFTSTNSRVVQVSNSSSGSSSGGSTGLGKGPLKKIESGPSSAEWYDASSFWSTMFKNAGSAGLSGDGGNGGIIQMLQNEICLFARRMRIRLPFCPLPRKTTIFQVAKKSGQCPS